MEDLQIQRAAADLEGRTPLEILQWAAGRFAPRLTFGTGFGVEGAVLIDLIGRARLAVDLFTLDTGLFFPETEALWQRLQERYSVRIRAVRPDRTVAEQAVDLGDRLWQRDPDQCCRLRKIEPLTRELRNFDAWISAIRRDQTRDRAAAAPVERDQKFGLVKINPLVGWSSEQVWAYVREHDVPFNPLHVQGFPSIGCAPCTTPVAPGEDPRAGRWRGREKTECGLHERKPQSLNA